MCGIAGILSFDGRPLVEQELLNMCAAIVHRGPDDDGFYTAAGIGLAMRRLSIIDVAAGHQPLSNEDGSVWAVFNGEIYNFRELRTRLLARGHVFATRSDTEVIVHLYEEYGSDCLQHMRGMFGVAVWDTRRKQLLLARDRLGIKPLYYGTFGGRLLFASELKALLQLPEVERDLNWRAVAHLFTFLTTPRSESIIQGVRKLEPGQRLIATADGAVSVEPYWTLQFEPDESKTEAWFAGRTRELIAESVRLHMVSDVPVGAFLSGGIDSSAVVAAAAKESPAPLKTFSIGFQEPDYNELGYARTVAQHFGTDHRELTLGPDALEEIEQISWHLDEPFGDSSAIPTYMVSKLAAESVKVVLSGDGGDELFAGYDKYVVEQREQGLRSLPPAVRRLFSAVSRTMPPGMRGRNRLYHRSLAGEERYLDSVTLFRRNDLCGLLRPEVAELVSPHSPASEKAKDLKSRKGHWLSRLQEFDIANYLPLDILTKVDRMSMAHSIETRVPLLDHKLVEFAATIPPAMNLRAGATKGVLKQAMRGTLPAGIIDRPKRGFAIPLGYWFRGRLGTYAHELLLGDCAKRRGLFEPVAIQNLLARHSRGESLDLQLWTLMSFELWARTFLDRGAKNIAAA